MTTMEPFLMFQYGEAEEAVRFYTGLFDDGEIPMTGSDTKVRDDALLALVHDRLAATQVPTPSGER